MVQENILNAVDHRKKRHYEYKLNMLLTFVFVYFHWSVYIYHMYVDIKHFY